MRWELLTAELTADGVAVDVFRLFPDAPQDPSVAIAVTHLHRPCVPALASVIMLHGEFSNRSQWYRQGEDCIARHLLEQRFDVWLPEMRGHGHSPVNRAYGRNTLQDYAVTDLPAVQSFVSSRGRLPTAWAGYGLGALTLVVAVEKGLLASQSIAGLILVALDDVRALWRRALPTPWSRWKARRSGVVVSKARQHGVCIALEQEPFAVLSGLRKVGFSGFSDSPGAVSGTSLLVIEPFRTDSPDDLLSKTVMRSWAGTRCRKISVGEGTGGASPTTMLLESPNSLKAIGDALVQWLREESGFLRSDLASKAETIAT